MASVTFKIVQNDTVREDGTQLVLMRITYQRKHKYIGTGVYVRAKHFNPDATTDKANWIRKSYGDDSSVQTLNSIIRKWLEKGDQVKRVLNELQLPYSVADVKSRLENEQANVSLSQFIRDAIKRFHDRNQRANARNHEAMHRHLSRFMNVDIETGDFYLHELTPDVLTKFETFMLNRAARHHSTTQASRRNSTSEYLRKLHQHIKAFIIARKLPDEADPYRGRKFETMPTEPVELTDGEMYIWETTSLPLTTQGERSLNNARNIYLASYYLHGLRAGDLVTARVSQLQYIWQMQAGKPVQQYRFYTVSQKKHKAKSILVHENILPILLEYAAEKEPDDFLFPFLPNKCKNLSGEDFEEAVRIRIIYIDKLLKTVAKTFGIDKPVSMHSARHTFAEQLYDMTGDVRLVSGSLSHSRLSTTEKYLTRNQQTKLDTANVVYKKRTVDSDEESDSDNPRVVNL